MTALRKVLANLTWATFGAVILVSAVVLIPIALWLEPEDEFKKLKEKLHGNL